MSNTILNIRLGVRHLQVLRFSDWRHRWPISFRINPYQVAQRETNPDWRWFEWM